MPKHYVPRICKLSSAFTFRPSALSLTMSILPCAFTRGPSALVTNQITAQVPSLMVPQHELTYDGFPHAFTQGPSALKSIPPNYSSAFTQVPQH